MSKSNERRLTIQNEKLYTLQEVAEMLRVSERSIFRYIYAKKLKATKIGYWRIKGSDIIGFLHDGCNVKEYIKTPKKK